MSVVERMMHYVVPDFINLRSPQLGYSLGILADAPFRLYGIALFPMGGALGANIGQVKLRFTRNDQSWAQRHLIPSLSLAPGVPPATNVVATFPSPNYFLFSPVYPNLIYQPRSTITIDIQRIDGTTENLNSVLVFIGTNLYEEGRIWSPSYPKNYRSIPYFGYNVLCSGSLLQSGPVRDVPLNVQPDADFVWQGTVHTDTPNPGDGSGIASGQGIDGNLINLGVRIKDWSGKYYSNAEVTKANSAVAGYVPAALLAGFNNGQLPGLVYPEIYVPKNGTLSFDFAMLDGTLNPNNQSPILTLKGQKVYS